MTTVIDLFPAVLTVGEDTFLSVRVVVATDGRARAVTADAGLLWQGQLVARPSQPVGGRRRPWYAETVDGLMFELVQAGGCGCGNPTKRLSRSQIWAM